MASRYPPNTRARDIDRANTSALLDAAFGDGQINKAEHRAMSELASEARTLADLDVLVGDLQRPADAPPDARPPRDTARPWFPLAVAAVAVAAAVGAFTLADGDDAEATVTPVAQQIDFDAVEPLVVATPNPVSPEGMKVFLDRYRAKFGDLIVDDLTLYEGGHASLERALPLEPNRMVSYDYRGGFTPSGTPTTRKVDTPVFDLTTLNLDRIGGTVAGAPVSLNVPDGKVSHISFQTGSAGPTVSVYVNNEFSESGYMELTPSGEPLSVRPFGR
ncbi:DUF1707 SHOCT-like domain-containing protein [Rhodococcus koreensis]|uniref:DUF1707 SHOCT-like domain-containing protein n=1 Tax=Rhodococcus koreensis TaxID=99653 RepID=UPI00197F92F8|nr:DUF1707 domain-containing protein [Rhodococcus koreensis]QSE80925.1 DUF1707 domain-containing protein [Rhodococcus koreensis]